MKHLDQHSTLCAQVLRDFKRWAADQLPPDPGMVGQTETHFPCKAAYAVAIYDHDQERFTAIKVMLPEDGRLEWYELEID